MRSASTIASKRLVVLYPECRNRMGLRAASLPFKQLDLGQSASHLGEVLKQTLAASSVAPGKNKNHIDRSGELLKAVGLTSWSEGACCSITDDDDGVLRFLPERPDGTGHEGRPSDAIAVPIDSSCEAIGAALVRALEQARKFTRLD